MQTGKKINQISNRLRRRSRAIQETIGISGAQGNILNYILVESQSRSVYQKDIEQEFGLRPSTATETLKSLEKNGLIKRETDPNDGRYKKIVFTEKAEQIEAVLKSEIEESETILLQGVTKEERQQIKRDEKRREEPLKRRTKSGSAVQRQQSASTEINILGNTVDEAVIKVGHFIDQALLAGISPVKIIHGKGTGALRAGVQDYLRSLSVVNHFELAGFDDGGAGATIVYLK